MAATPREGLQTLITAAENGELAALCRRHNIVLLTVFGSVLDEDREPRDLDIAVYFAPKADRDVLGVIGDLIDLTHVNDIDLMELNRARAVARNQALTYGEPLYDEPPGRYARMQAATLTETFDLEPLVQLDLQLMAEGHERPAR